MFGHGTESGLTSLEFEDLEEKLGVPSGGFAACFNAAFGFVCADEAEGETADDGHVFGAVA